MEAERRPAPPDLHEVVECFWLGRWDLPAEAPHTTRLLGDPCIHFCFERSHSAGWVEQRLVGVWTRTWERRLEGKGVVRAAKLRPGAAAAFGLDAARSRNRQLPLAQVPGGESPDPALFSEDDDEAFEAVARLLRERRVASPDTPRAQEAVEAAREDPSLLRVAQLASQLGLSERALQRLFATHVGASPKFVIRRHRLQEAARRLEVGEVRSLADLAYELGYADQAHLARDFKAAVGVAPSVFSEEVHR